jgi:primase-polymerase (primpol)-like protein
MMFQSVPEELRTLKRWHLWKDIDGTKVPFRLGGQPAKSNDPETWCGFEFAVGSVKNYSGIAFELGDGYAGVDLDNCIDENDNLRQWAWKIVDRFDGLAYAEISPSGRGIKLITRGQKPEGSRCVYKVGDDKQQLECYDRARFWTVTGNVYNRQKDIGDGQAALNWLCETYLTPVAPAPYVAPTVSSGFGLEQRAASYTDNASSAGPGDRNNSAFRLAICGLWSGTTASD